MNKYTKTSCILLSIGLLAYSILRAFNIPFTHDESFTYLYSSHNSFMEIISNRTELTSANNHILNTLLMKLFEILFGSNEIALRLQSILAHAVYLWFCFLLLKPLRSNISVILGFILLNFNPYQLEFFSLARGYALAMAFMLISIYYLTVYLKEERTKQLIYTMVSAGLAVLSNFGLFYFFGSLLLFIFLFLFFKYKKPSLIFPKSRAILITIVLMVVICYEPIRKLIKFHQFEFGGSTGIWHDTFSSTMYASLYTKQYHQLAFPFIEFISITSLLAAGILIIVKLLRKKSSVQDLSGFIFFILLICIVLLNTLFHHILGSPFLSDRYAVFLLPLLSFVLIFVLDELINSRIALRLTGITLFLIISGAWLLHFGQCANISFTTNWKYDSNTKEMLLDLNNKKGGAKHLKLGITWIFQPTIDFYRETLHLDWLEPVNRNGIDESYEYYYVEKEDFHKADSLQLIQVKEYPLSGTRLLKKE